MSSPFLSSSLLSLVLHSLQASEAHLVHIVWAELVAFDSFVSTADKSTPHLTQLSTVTLARFGGGVSRGASPSSLCLREAISNAECCTLRSLR